MEDAYVHMHIYLSEFIEFIRMPLTGNKERGQSSSAGTHSTRPPALRPGALPGKCEGCALLEQSAPTPALPQPHLCPDEGPARVGLKVTK